MKGKLVIITFLSIVFLASSCSNDEDKHEKMLRQLYIDISDFTMYKGSPDGGVEISFNNLKKKELVEKYLSKVYTPDRYANITLQFNNEKLTYIESKGYANGIQIVSDFQIQKDSLFIKTSNANENLKFVALVDLNGDFYRRQGLISYPDPYYDPNDDKQTRVKQDSLSTVVNLDTVLKKAGYNSIKDLTNPEDTIIWCNVIYPFN